MYSVEWWRVRNRSEGNDLNGAKDSSDSKMNPNEFVLSSTMFDSIFHDRGSEWLQSWSLCQRKATTLFAIDTFRHSPNFEANLDKLLVKQHVDVTEWRDFLRNPQRLCIIANARWYARCHGTEANFTKSHQWHYHSTMRSNAAKDYHPTPAKIEQWCTHTTFAVWTETSREARAEKLPVASYSRSEGHDIIEMA